MLVGIRLVIMFLIGHRQTQRMRTTRLGRSGSRVTSNNSVGEQNSNYLLRKTKVGVAFRFGNQCPWSSAIE